MNRLFLPLEHLASKEIIINGENARYLSLVLRVQPGESIAILDGHGKRYICNILSVHKKEVSVEKIKEEYYSSESPISITLAQGLTKGDKMDLIVQKSTELGVIKIIPIITERSQVRTTEKASRWRKIAVSASQQSGRDIVPEIDEPIKIEEFLRRCVQHKGLIFSETYNKRNLKETLSNIKDTKQITLLIGPEGGFSKDEVTNAVKSGFAEASLGPRILRTETAPISAISILQYELGDSG